MLGGRSLDLSVVVGFLALRFLAGPLSYAAAVPGGLFAPLLAVGALWGLLFAGGLNTVLSEGDSSLVVPMAIVGMAAFFGAVVRAPVTAIVLVMEMTFVAPSHRKDKIHKFGHMHLDDVIARRERFKNEVIIASHFSTRYNSKRIRDIVGRMVPDAFDGRLHLWL